MQQLHTGRRMTTAQDSRPSALKRLYAARFDFSVALLHHCNNKFIHATNSFFMTDSSLSTFDSSVSCLYFFVYETKRNFLQQYTAVNRDQDGIPATVKNALRP
jgi:hypothetical protein